MSPSRKPKRPQATHTPSGKKEPRTASGLNPEAFNQKKIAWGFEFLDQGGPWGLKAMNQDWQVEILPKLRMFESMTWQEILSASGAKKKGRGNHHHSVAVEKLSKDAQKRLKEIKLDDVESLFSLRLTGRKRLYVIRDGRVFKFIWYDREHEVYLSSPN